MFDVGLLPTTPGTCPGSASISRNATAVLIDLAVTSTRSLFHLEDVLEVGKNLEGTPIQLSVIHRGYRWKGCASHDPTHQGST